MTGRSRAILFDMDNTLYDFVEAKQAACESVVDVIGTGEATELLQYFLCNMHGFEHHDNIRDYMKDKNVWNEGKFAEACRVYEEVKLDSVVAFAGVHDTLERILDAGIAMAVVTDAQSIQAERRLRKTGLYDYFSCIASPDISGKRKPQHDSFLLALDRLKAAPQDAWVVGDSLRREIEPGNSLGMTTVYARYGDWLNIPFPSIKPDYIIDDFSDLPGLLGID